LTQRPAEPQRNALVSFARYLKDLFAVALIVFFVFTSTVLAHYYSLPLYAKAEPQNADVIVLLSSGQIDKRWLSVDGSQRTLGALDLYRRGFARFIISSGSQPLAELHQAELQAEWLVTAGVPREAIIVESRSSRTYDSAVEVAALMRQHGWHSAVVVTSAMDVRRVRLVFRKLGVTASYFGVPEFHTPPNVVYFPTGLAVFYHATYEYAGLVFYKLKGWI
jgi:uncharacterized SAM-binding protein YcdF (DUF218 family)